MYCRECGQDLPEGVMVCPVCGTEVDETEEEVILDEEQWSEKVRYLKGATGILQRNLTLQKIILWIQLGVLGINIIRTLGYSSYIKNVGSRSERFIYALFEKSGYILGFATLACLALILLELMCYAELKQFEKGFLATGISCIVMVVLHNLVEFRTYIDGDAGESVYLLQNLVGTVVYVWYLQKAMADLTDLIDVKTTARWKSLFPAYSTLAAIAAILIFIFKMSDTNKWVTRSMGSSLIISSLSVILQIMLFLLLNSTVKNFKEIDVE